MTRFSILWLAALAGALRLQVQSVAPPAALNSQPAVTNHVLDLDDEVERIIQKNATRQQEVLELVHALLAGGTD